MGAIDRLPAATNGADFAPFLAKQELQLLQRVLRRRNTAYQRLLPTSSLLYCCVGLVTTEATIEHGAICMAPSRTSDVDLAAAATHGRWRLTSDQVTGVWQVRFSTPLPAQPECNRRPSP